MTPIETMVELLRRCLMAGAEPDYWEMGEDYYGRLLEDGFMKYDAVPDCCVMYGLEIRYNPGEILCLRWK